MPTVTGRLRTPSLAAAPASPVAGEMYYDNVLNSLFTWNGTFWVPAGKASGCQVWNNANITLTNGATTILTWNSETYDTDNYHSTVTNTSRLTVPTAGFYLVTAMLDVQSGATAALDTMYFYISGNARYNHRKHPEASANARQMTTVMQLVAGDYVECAYFNGNTAAHTLTGSQFATNFTIMRLGT